MKDKETAEKGRAHNEQKFFEEGPRLSYNRSTWLIMKDTKNEIAMIGGLGSMSVGTMWTSLEEAKKYPDFNDIPEVRVLNHEDVRKDSFANKAVVRLVLPIEYLEELRKKMPWGIMQATLEGVEFDKCVIQGIDFRGIGWTLKKEDPSQ